MFLLDSLESRVHFERLCDCLSGFGIEVVVTETASKGEGERKEVGKEEAKVSVRIPKERVKQGRPLQECKVWFVRGGRCSYSILWSVVFTLSASAIALPASAPSTFIARLQAKRT